MSTLAEEFLADISDYSKVEDLMEMSEAPKAEPPIIPTNVRDVAKLIDSQRLRDIVKRIEAYSGTTKTEFIGDHDPEYDLIVTSNAVSVDISNEIGVIHKFIRDIYSKKFPELESLVLHPLDYARVARRIGNNLSSSTIQSLDDILPAANIITISMAASSTAGVNLDDNDLKTVFEACDVALLLDDSRQKILAYVEGRMQVFAPNLTAIVGCEIATKLIGTAGGLHKLAMMPSCNVFVLGKTKTTLEGFSSASTVRHHGYVTECEITRKAPLHMERKVCRLVANKCSLAARLDYAREHYLQGEMGHKFREEIEKKIEKWQEPPPKKKEKVLPAPDDMPKKKRGGQRRRKEKQRYAITEMRKRAMRLPFGHITEEYGNTMKSFGMLGMEGSGIVRMNVREEKGFKVPKPKKRKQKGGKDSTTTGYDLSSVYAITPFQGLELKTPDAKLLEQQDSTEGYFSTTGGFLRVGNKK